VNAATRAKVAAWLPRLLEAVVAPWLTHRPDDPLRDGVAQHGVPAWETTRDAVRSAVSDVVLEGFDQLAVDTGPARAWWRLHRGG
jgi:hypothetical protein